MRALIQYASDDEYRAMLALTAPLHRAYCERHGIDLILNYQPPHQQPVYCRKVELLMEHLQIYEQVMWLDADCILVAQDYNVFDASGFGIAVCECRSPAIIRHLQTGVIFATRSDEVLAFLQQWYKHPMDGVLYANEWGDQAAFRELMQDDHPHRDLLTILPNRFNMLDVHMAARDPFVLAFHGVADRLAVMERALQAWEWGRR
jgi:hypothetical protein